MLQNRRFSAWALRSGFGAAVCIAVLRNSIVFCNLVSADRSGIAASRFLTAAAACEILVSFAAEIRKSYCSSGMKVANDALAADFFHFGADDSPFKFLSKSSSESSFFRFGVEIRFWSCNLCSRCAYYCVKRLFFPHLFAFFRIRSQELRHCLNKCHHMSPLV